MTPATRKPHIKQTQKQGKKYRSYNLITLIIYNKCRFDTVYYGLRMLHAANRIIQVISEYCDLIYL